MWKTWLDYDRAVDGDTGRAYWTDQLLPVIAVLHWHLNVRLQEPVIINYPPVIG